MNDNIMIFKKSVKWSLIGQLTFFSILFISNLFFSNILTVEEYSIIGILTFLLTIFKMLIDSGMSGALIRNGFANNNDYFILLCYNVFISFLIFILINLYSSYIISFFNNKINKNMILLLSFIFILSAFQVVYNTRMIIELNYKLKSIIELFSISSSFLFIIIVTYFYKEFGIWLYILMQFLNVFLLLVVSIFSNERFNFRNFDFKRFKKFYKYGIVTTINSFFNIIFENISQIIILKYFSSSLYSFYIQANKNQDIPFTIFRSLNLGVNYSKLSKHRYSEKEFNIINKSIILNSFSIILFISSLLLFYTDTFFLLIYSNKWVDSIFITRILIIGSIFLYLDSYSRMYFKIFDKTIVLFKIDILKKLLYAVFIFLAIYLNNFYLLLYGYLTINIIGFFINNFAVKKYIKFLINAETPSIYKLLLYNSFFLCFIYFISDKFKFNFLEKFYLLPFYLIYYFLFIKNNLKNII
jgi:O-antigen/teichoic acid export membrane protein